MAEEVNMKKRKHYILTRYNLGLYRTKHPGRAREWMEKRLAMFNTFCVPSLDNQTCQNFEWIILVDSNTPAQDLDALRMATVTIPTKFIITEWPDKKFKEGDSVSSWREEFVQYVSKQCKQAIMTRLDNDDAIHEDFVKDVQESILEAGDGEYIVDFPTGIMYDSVNEKCYLAKHSLGSPFITLVENCGHDMQTVYGTFHYKMARKYQPIICSAKLPRWMMVIHSSNKTNRIFDKMIAKELEFKSVALEFGL
jgi:hypothetical protein